MVVGGSIYSMRFWSRWRLQRPIIEVSIGAEKSPTVGCIILLTAEKILGPQKSRIESAGLAKLVSTVHCMKSGDWVVKAIVHRTPAVLSGEVARVARFSI